MTNTITKIFTRDARFQLPTGSGSDAIHRDPVYSYAATLIADTAGNSGTGLAFTLGEGNDLVCKAATFLAQRLEGKEIEEVMAEFGRWSYELSNEQQFRWLGPHKGIVHLALASVTNACFDLWAKKRGVPLWRLLLDLTPEALVDTLDLSYLEDVLTREEALSMIRAEMPKRVVRQDVLTRGYRGYDTSVGWFNYDDETVRENCRKAIAAGFTAMKLKVGSRDPERDLRRAHLLREAAGEGIRIMFDANQQWTLPQALKICKRLRAFDPYWIEEPTHPDDVIAHKILSEAIVPTKLALGEHVPNRIIFKNYLRTGCVGFCQVDAVRVAGISEFLTISLLCRKFGVPVVPHVGDMGQLHQHLVLVNHIAFGHEDLFLEVIPHLQKHFIHPVSIKEGYYQTPQAAGSSCDLR